MPEIAPVCVVTGIGPGNGEALVRRFSADGYALRCFQGEPG